MENFIPQDQVPNLYKANFRFREGSSRKYKRALKRKNEKPAKFLTIINNIWMNTTTATYQISVTTDEGSLSFLKDMPTRPKTQKGIKSQNNKLSRWVEKEYPNYIEYEIALVEC